VLGDEGRLRLLALCAAEELTVGELALLLDESQPQVTKKSQPLRDADLLAARKDGTRTLLSTTPTDDVVVRAALDEGRALCTRDGSLARVERVVAQREEGAWKFFAEPHAHHQHGAHGHGAGHVVVDQGLLRMLPMFAPLIAPRALAVDAGAGEGALLPLLAPIFERVIAFDRSAARLARCAERVDARGLHNVRLLEGDVEAAHIVEEIERRGRADFVLMARVLHHVARPAETLAAAARLAKTGAHVVVVEHLPHDDERAREHGAVWLGFTQDRLAGFFEKAGLDVVARVDLDAKEQVMVGRKRVGA